MSIAALERWKHREEVRHSIERFDRMLSGESVTLKTGHVIRIDAAGLERARRLRTREQLVERLAEVEGD